MKIVSLGSEPAIIKHRKRRDSEACPEETLGTDTRNDSNYKGSQDRDHCGTRAQDQSRVGRGIAEKRLKNLGDQHRATEQTEGEDEIVGARECKVPLAQKSQFDDRIVVTPFPPDRKCYCKHRQNKKSRDEVATKPVVPLSPI
jgi:hypothetical protein